MGRRVRARRPISLAVALGLGLLAAACAGGPPDNPDNACAIFKDKRAWWDASRDAERRWGAPPSLQLAIMNQESSFMRKARPDRTKLLFVVPWRRPSSAYGYAQATENTWDQYKRETGRGGADRDSYRDAADFVGWYTAKTREINGLPFSDGRGHYLAYHEGQGGYARGSYRGKRDVQATADRVGARAALYERQLDTCRRSLGRRFLFF